MNIKNKIALTISIAFSLLFGMVMMMIYASFSDFRKEEFRERFSRRLVFTVHFISNSKNFEKEAPVFFDEDEDNVLLNEKILIFDKDKQLIYSTIKDENISWSNELLISLDKNKIIYQEDSNPDVYAVLRNINGENYYILTFAEDTNGESKLAYLKYLLITSYFISVLAIGFLSYYFMRKFLTPLEKLNKEISEITAHKLTTQIPLRKTNDEIDILAQSFNTMIKRLNNVFQSQKDFTSSASHEIKTPLTRMSFQLENLAKLEDENPDAKKYIEGISDEVYQLSDTVNSLLLLSQLEEQPVSAEFSAVRMDEVIFEAFEKVKKNFSDFEINFNINEQNDLGNLTVKGIKPLLEIVFVNLFKNGCLYSFHPEIEVNISETETQLVTEVVSVGTQIDEEDSRKIFDNFHRGANSHRKSGSGLGLSISKRILEFHNAKITYRPENENRNIFILQFPLK